RRSGAALALAPAFTVLRLLAYVSLPALFLFPPAGDHLGGANWSGAAAWLVIGIPVLAAVSTYAVWLYTYDMRSVGVVVGLLLIVLRLGVFATLALAFLLPAEQPVDKRTEHSEVVLLFDVSDSMLNVDDLPRKGESLDSLLSRQAKVLKFLT